MKKMCTECNQLKDISEFTPQKRGKFGVKSKCKLCINIKHRKYLSNNPEKLSKYRKTDSKNNPISHWCRAAIKSHKRVGYIVEFTVKELATLVTNTPRCKYCGSELYHNTPYGERKDIPKTNHPTIDRTDNGMVLRLDNIEIICWKCNVTKYDRTEKEFYEYCRNIYKTLNKKYEV